MMRSDRNPDRLLSFAAGVTSIVEPTRRGLALQLVDLECDPHAEQVPVDDAVGEDLPLRDAPLYVEVEARQLPRPVVDADPVDAGIEARDLEPFDQDTVDEALDHAVGELIVRQ